MTVQLPDHRVGMKRDYEWLPVRPIACPSCGASTPFPPYGLPVCPDCKHEIGPDKANLHSLCYSRRKSIGFIRYFFTSSDGNRLGQVGSPGVARPSARRLVIAGAGQMTRSSGLG